MQSVFCSECKSANTIKSDYSNHFCCYKCNAVQNLKSNELISKSLVLIPDFSPISINQTLKKGEYEYLVIGRIRIRHEDGYFNLWALDLTSKKKELEYLLEFGGYYFYGNLQSEPIINNRIVLKVGKKVKYKSSDAILNSIHKNLRLEFEGEFSAELNFCLAKIVYCFVLPNGGFLMNIKFKDEQINFYSSNVLSYNSLKIKH